MSGGEVENGLAEPANPHKLYIILEFTHYQKHVVFTMDGADFMETVRIWTQARNWAEEIVLNQFIGLEVQRAYYN